MKPIITKTLFLFTLVQIAALFAGLKFTEQHVSVVQNSASADNSLYLFATIVAFAAILLLVLKLYKGKLLFLLLELAMEFTALQLFVGLFTASGIVPTLIALAAIILRLKVPQVRQPLLMATIAIVGGLLGSSLDILPASLLAILLAGYDIVAVFYTKHMVTLAKELTSRQAAFSLKIIKGKDKLELGTGDVVIPAMLIVAANRIGKTALHIGTDAVSTAAILGIIGAVIGIAALLFYMEKRKGYWPALPPITIGCLAGILLATTLL